MNGSSTGIRLPLDAWFLIFSIRIFTTNASFPISCLHHLVYQALICRSLTLLLQNFQDYVVAEHLLVLLNESEFFLLEAYSHLFSKIHLKLQTSRQYVLGSRFNFVPLNQVHHCSCFLYLSSFPQQQLQSLLGTPSHTEPHSFVFNYCNI